MQIVLLSGGSGKRLWPLSNEIRSKQFIKILENGDVYESMVQRVYRQIKNTLPDATVTFATSKTQVSSIRNQLGSDVGISVEPCRRDTFPAIALATAYLRDVCSVDNNEPIIICPVDPFVDDEYFATLKIMADQVAKQQANLVLMGITPTYPSDKYGYIIPTSEDSITTVETFKEKPSREIAMEYLKQGALWNGGVFAFKLGYMLKIVTEKIGFSDYTALINNYENLKSISFDYAVVEKEKVIEVVKYSGEWKDVGTWNTLTEAMSSNVYGNGILDDACDNVHIVNELELPVLAMGIKDAVISASPDGILVADKIQSGYIKKYVDKLDQEAMFAEKSWGQYRVLSIDSESLTAQITVNAGAAMSYHSHAYRNEVWTIISGRGITIVDGMEQEVSAGDVIAINVGCRHTIKAVSTLKLVEVQLGKEISAHDKTKYEL